MNVISHLSKQPTKYFNVGNTGLITDMNQNISRNIEISMSQWSRIIISKNWAYHVYLIYLPIPLIWLVCHRGYLSWKYQDELSTLFPALFK